MKNYLLLVCVLSGMFVFAQHARSLQSVPYQQSQKVDALCKQWDKKNTAGLALAILKDGKVIYQKEYGMANVEKKIEINDSTIFHVASIAKQFTVFSVLLLEEQGKLSLDNDVRKYIPELPQFESIITLKQLANHTSGLRDQWELLELSGNENAMITKSQVFKLIKKQQHLNFKAGEQYMYSNTGSFLLAEVIERVSKQSFIEFTQQHIFQPLEMKNTFFATDQSKLSEQCAESYSWNGKDHQQEKWSCQIVGPTNLKTTTTDLSKWMMSWSTYKVDLFEKMKTITVTNNSKHTGLGLFKYAHRGLDMFVHAGGDAGFRAYMAQIPSERFGVIILGNTAEVRVETIAMDVIDIYLKDKQKKSLITKQVSTKLLKGYKGDYRLIDGFQFTISEKKGELFLQGLGQKKYSMTALSDTSFFINDIKREATVYFLENHKVRLEQSFDVLEGVKENAVKMDLKVFEGKYYSEELDKEYQVIPENKQLYIYHEKIGKLPLTALEPNVFFWRKFKLEFKDDGCFISTSRMQNVHFRKEMIEQKVQK